MNRRIAAAALAFFACACTSRAHAPPIPVRTDVHSEAGLVVVVHDDGSLIVRRERDGAYLRRFVGPSAAGRSYGRMVEVPDCRTHVTSNGRLVVPYDHEVRVFDLDAGRFDFKITLPRAGGGRLCPTLSADEKILVHAASFHGSGLLLKMGRDDDVVFRATIPDIGPLVGGIEVDERTGDIVLTSRTHVLAFSPDGRVNWARSVDEGAPR